MEKRDLARILIVDDNKLIVEGLSMVVSSRGHVPLTAFSGEEALKVVASAMPDVVLLDLTMPGIDGFETLRRLRKMPQGQGLPVLIVTARDEFDLESQVAEAGGNGLLKKPVDVNLLAAQITLHTSEAKA
ncbi:MAG: response regulator [Chloroflexota bacterium]